MIIKKHITWFLIGGLILTVFMMFLPVVYTKFYHEITSTSKAINAKMDLSEADLTKRKIYVDGQWEFYWQRLIMTEPHIEEIPDFMIKVPEEWSNYKINGNSLPVEGYASYKLTLLEFDYNYAVALYIPDFSGAYKVYIDGKLTSKSGFISKNTDEIFTVPKADLYPVTLTDHNSHEVIIEVATTKFSGLYMTPILVDYEKYAKENNVRSSVRFILFGIALFAFTNLLSMYLLSVRQKLHSSWLPIMIFLILIRIMLTTEFYSFWQQVLFFGHSYEATNELMYLTTFILKYLLIYLVQEQCGINFSRREKARFLIFYSALFLAYLLVPKNIYNQNLSVLIPMLTYTLDIYMFVKIYINREKLMKFGMIVFWAANLINIGLSLDSFYINGKIYINMSIAMLLMIMIFLIIISWIYSMRIRDLYDDFTVSASRLEMANKQITMQKEYYNVLGRQMNEIREIKHDINHFIGVMHGLVEGEKFNELKDFLDEYSVKTRMEQLPIFCEHTIANTIIGYYYLMAKKDSIPFETQCTIDRKISMSDSDLCIVLGNALDNAISACKQMDSSLERFIIIEARLVNGHLLIKMANSYNGQLEIKNGQYMSSKGGSSHGFGIKNIHKVVEGYGGFIKIEHDGKIFSCMAAIPQN